MNVIRPKVTVVESDPPIWRQLEIDRAMTLDQVHGVLQTAFDWQDYHLHLFSDEDVAERSRTRKLHRVPTSWGDQDQVDEGIATDLETETTLGDVLTGNSRPLVYEYDFGDGWRHLLEFIELAPREADAPGAVLVRGERRGPLEDAGGMYGYSEKLEAIADPTHEEHDEMLSWAQFITGPWRTFDPDDVPIEAVNADLRATFPALNAALPLPRSLGDSVLARLPVGLRRDFRAYLADALASGPDTVIDATAERMLRPYLWLIRRVGNDGLPVSAASWLPPDVVSDAMRDLGWGGARGARRIMKTTRCPSCTFAKVQCVSVCCGS